MLSSTADEAGVDYLVPLPDVTPVNVLGPDDAGTDGIADFMAEFIANFADEAELPTSSPLGHDITLPVSLSFLVAAAVAIMAFAQRHRLVRGGARFFRSGMMLGLLAGSQYPQHTEAHNWCVTPSAYSPHLPGLRSDL